MANEEYSKPALTYGQQLDLLEHRGLIIEDVDKASHLLEVISYYRFSGYLYPFLIDKQNHVFKEGSSFETVFNIIILIPELWGFLKVGKMKKSGNRAYAF